VDQGLKEKLDEIKEVSGKSVGDILREAVGTQAASAKSAYEKGYAEAKKEFGVTYKCAVCGGTIWIISPEEKKDAGQCMREHGWAHGECFKKYG
jgi:hypothetical protein